MYQIKPNKFSLLIVLVLLVAEPLLCQNQVMVLDGDFDYTEIPHASDYDNSQLTIEFWFKKDNDFIEDTPGQIDMEGLIYKGYTTSADRHFNFGIKQNSAPFFLNFSVSNGGTVFQLNSESIIQAFEWYHVAGVIDEQSISLYINGILQGSAEISGSVNYVSAPIVIGKVSSESYANRHYHGHIDDIRLWNEARSESEILDYLGSPLQGDEENLVGYWTFDDATAIDLTSHMNDGLMYDDTHTSVDIYSWMCSSIGDVSGDGQVNISDILHTVNIILSNPTISSNRFCADINGDSALDVSDLVQLVELVLGN